MKITLTFIIQGEDFSVEVNPNEPLKAARNKVLAESRNNGRAHDDWEVRTELGGILLDPDQKIQSLGLKSGTRLLLTVKLGGGGADAYRTNSLP